ncbi:tail fiber domain-containing protein [Candidatus Dojkabacteria bacterium]|jgi:hypothetical protein|nr:tail fiber domain-containing protein [Candidatus Dojkabacteria bacterium]
MEALFNIFNQQEYPSIILCNPDKTALYSLGLAYEITNNLKYNAISELEFKYPQSHDGGLTIDPVYELLIGKRLILVDGIGYYVISNIEEDLDGSVAIKNVTAQSLESELFSRRITGFPANFTHTIMEVLDYVLENSPGWTRGYVDPFLQTESSIKGATATEVPIYRTFDTKNTTIYKFLIEDLEKAFGCVLEFDSFEKKVNAYSSTFPNTNTNIVLSFDNLVQEVEFKEVTDEICTALYCYGGGTVDIRDVNPLGGNAIYNFDYFKTSHWMSESLITALNKWETLVREITPYYQTNLSELQTILEEINKLEEQVEVRKVNLAANKKALEALLTIKEEDRTDAENRKIIRVRGYILKNETHIASAKVSIKEKRISLISFVAVQMEVVHGLYFTRKLSYISFREDLESMAANTGSILGSWRNTYVKPAIPLTNPLPKEKIREIALKIHEVNNNIKALLEYITDLITNWGTLNRPHRDTRIEIISQLNGEIRSINTLMALFTRIIPDDIVLLEPLDNIVIRLMGYKSVIKESQFGVTYTEGERININDHPVYLTPDQYTELSPYIFENTYTNKNLVVGKEPTLAEKRAISLQLYNQGKGVSGRTSQPRYEFSGKFINFLALQDFSSFISELELGRLITIKKNDDSYIRTALLEINIPYDSPEDLELTFSNSFRINNPKFIWANMMSEAVELGAASRPPLFLDGTMGGWVVGTDKLTGGLQNNANSFTNVTVINQSPTPTAYVSSLGYISFGNPPPEEYGDKAGAWLGYMNEPKFSLYSNTDNYLQWDGNRLLIKAQNFTLDAEGNITATSATLSGHITAAEGYIGGWTIGATSLTDTAGLVGMSSEVTLADDIRFWAGHVTPASAPFSVTEAGVINATSGTIGGNALGTTFISSTTFVSGALGSGWRIINTGEAEFQNVTVRGILKTAVFQKDTISVVNGQVLITSGDVLASDMTALDASTLTIKGNTTFYANEVIRLKDGLINDEWMLITDTASAPTYVVTRDLAGSYASNDNPVWKTGTTVASMGRGAVPNKTGFIFMDSSSANSPFIDIYGRNSTTYNDYTLHARMGWLKGIVDADVGLSSTDVWGLYSDSVYLKGTIVASSGKIGGWVIGATSLTDLAGLVGMSSAVTGGDDIRFWAGHVTPSSAPFRVTEAGNLVATSATISGAITATSGTIGGWTIDSTQIRNSGSTVVLRAAGELAFGATPPASISSGTGLFLSSAGMYGMLSNVPQAIFSATTGAITAGAGAVKLDVSGITVIAGIAETSGATLKWNDSGGTPYFHISSAQPDAGDYKAYFRISDEAGGVNNAITIESNNGTPHIILSGNVVQAETGISAVVNGSGGGLYAGAASDVQLYRSSATLWRTPDGLTVDLGLNVGSASGAGTGDIKASGNATITGSGQFANVGIGMAPSATVLDVTGNMRCTGTAIPIGGITSQGVYDNTSATANYVVVLSNGVFRLLSSSIKYKKNVKNLALDIDKLMSIQPRTFNSKCKDDNQKLTHIGLIAEELYPIYPELVNVNEETSEISGINYGGVGVLALQLAQDNNNRINELEKKLERLIQEDK